MPTAPVSPDKQAEIEDLERAIHEAVRAEIAELAATLAATDDAHTFGQVEFRVRSIALRIAAKAFERHLARKKMDSSAFECEAESFLGLWPGCLPGLSSRSDPQEVTGDGIQINTPRPRQDRHRGQRDHRGGLTPRRADHRV